VATVQPIELFSETTVAGSGNFESAVAVRVPPIESEDATRIDKIAVLVCLIMTHSPFRSSNLS
jgi:hypothetical protein